MENSKIGWTDHTFNPWIGCTKVSPGCANCYAEARDQRFAGGAHWGPGAPRQRTSSANWKQPLKWNAAQERHQDFMNGSGDRPRVFCASLADWLDDEVPVQWLADLFSLIAATPFLDWLLLTKRPQNFSTRIFQAWHDASMNALVYSMVKDWDRGTAPENIWIGTTVEDQARSYERIPSLLEIPAKVRFLSCEPLLGSVHLKHIRQGDNQWFPMQHIHWLICGGESGQQARPMHPDWARSLRDQCASASVPFFFKQWGSNPHPSAYDSVPMVNAVMHEKNGGHILDGRLHEAFPGGAL